ncbi:amino acid adenylation domain-containing protein [Photorhabdus temperata]|uniref:Amino acid adenylation enzyme/thioester reductase family protein n=1 Tax=Photorhabdus temperata subsp. temperata Meg1 TaxID=1393735 RepID=A0A081S1Z5_PHOTE|nr:amino acid adenylation domain-containing protein [Photorhabdus temperata]KER04948.1 amino acid adenylation enzyme/thioester reductase family protein [Photorhabdus temperata subsp. temperata Meg1]MCT8346017.1 amino acid adenylation domain-containing protein [Photorhabdus temperata]
MIQSLINPQHKCTMLSRFFYITQKNKHLTAVKYRNQTVSYGLLNQWVGKIASYLSLNGVKPGDFVAVELTHSAELIASLLAVQALGAAYVPLDKKAPIERNQLILEDVKPVFIIGDKDNFHQKDYPFCDIYHCIQQMDISQSVSDSSQLTGVAYVIYTSGTTGKPKGVLITHNNLSALFEVTESFYQFNSRDVIMLYHSYAFDFSVWEIWSAIAYGGTLLIPDDETRIEPEKLSQLIKNENVTVLNQTPTAFSINAPKLMDFNRSELALRFIIFGGERLNFQALKSWEKKFGLDSPLLINMYGITETTVHATLHVVKKNDLDKLESIIGKVLPSFNYILRKLQDSPSSNDSGELLLSGRQVTKGYLNSDNTSSGKFIEIENNNLSRVYYCSGDIVKCNDNGELIYQGRIDQQVKVNGYRIETGEIESIMAQLDGIEDVCVIALRSEMLGDYLLCCFSSSIESDVTLIERFKILAKDKLPVYMRPLKYKRLDRIPRTVNGKIDKSTIIHSLELAYVS